MLYCVRRHYLLIHFALRKAWNYGVPIVNDYLSLKVERWLRYKAPTKRARVYFNLLIKSNVVFKKQWAYHKPFSIRLLKNIKVAYLKISGTYFFCNVWVLDWVSIVFFVEWSAICQFAVLLTKYRLRFDQRVTCHRQWMIDKQ